MRKITGVVVLDGYLLRLTFDDGKEGVVDLSHLAGKGVFSCWQDRKTFEKVQIGASGELLWDELVDLCPDALYMRITGLNVEDLFPSARNEAIHA